MATHWIDQDALTPPPRIVTRSDVATADRRLRIVICAWRDLANPLAGGSEVLIDRIAAGMTEGGHQVTLLAGGPNHQRDYPVVHTGSTYSQYLRAPLTYLRNFRDVDLVVDVCNGMPFLAPLWRRGPSVCLVNHVHTDQWDAWFPPIIASAGRTLESRIMPFAYRRDLFIAVSPSTAASLERLGVDHDRIRIVNNGVDMPTVVAPKSVEPLFLALGRLVPHKRIDLLLRVWNRIHERVGGKLVIAGSGPEAAALAAVAGPAVEFRGQISEGEKARLLSEAWMLLHPSMLEGWGLVIMEAAASGTPTLGFDVPGVRDSVVDGVSGMLVRSEDEMAERWVELATDAGLRKRLGGGARRVASQFSWSKTVDAFEAVATEAVAERRPALVIPTPLVVPSGARPLPPRTPAISRPQVSVVIPAFNEAIRLTRSLPPLLDALAGVDSELIVVDDGSDDGTADVAAGLLRGRDQTVLLRLPGHKGKGAAVRAGVAHARGNAIVFMDADLATDIGHLPEALEALDADHVVVGSRAAPGAVTRGASPVRARMGWVFNHFASAVTGLGVADFQCGFKAFRAPTAKVLFHLAQLNGFAFDVEVLMLAQQIGYSIAELPVRWEAVPGGHVRPARDAPAMAADVLRTRLRWTRSRILTAIEASCGDRVAAEEAVAALGARLRGFDPIVPWHDGALALLPFVEPLDAGIVAARIQVELPQFVVRAESIPAWDLLSPAASSLRHALAAA